MLPHLAGAYSCSQQPHAGYPPGLCSMRQGFVKAVLYPGFFAALALLSCSPRSASDCAADDAATGCKGSDPSAPPQLAEESGAPLSVETGLEADRAVRQVLSAEGGTLGATAADGSKFVLTIPPNALADNTEIALTPVADISGLPSGVTLAAAVQLSPDDLLLFEPARLVILPARAIAADQEITFSWSGGGEFVHAVPVSLQSETPEFHLLHFSGAGIAAGSDSAAQPIVKAPAARCSDEFGSRIVELIRRARVAMLSGRAVQGEEIIDAYAAVSATYLNDVLKPLVSEAARNDSLFPCLMSDYLAWHRGGVLFMGEAFDSRFGAEAEALSESLLGAPLSNFFEGCYSRCTKGESPVFQAVSMGAVIRHLEFMSRQDLLPANAFDRFLSCSRQVKFLVDIESQMSNVYNLQGQGIDVESSVTRLEGHGIVAIYDEEQSKAEARPVYTANPMVAEATVSVEWRNRCPNQVRIEPDATLEAVVMPILNPRVGRLLCNGGKPRCEPTNLNPGSMVRVIPYVVESTYLHTETGEQCLPANYWSEFMMYFMGSQSVGSDEPFQVPGTTGSFVRRGTSVRHVPLDIPPQMRAQYPEMKNYVEISTPAIESAVEQTRITIKTQRR